VDINPPAESDPAKLLKKAFHADDAVGLAQLLELHPEMKERINERNGPFDSPPIVNVRSRAMLDVLLEAGADLDAKSDWWAGGFGLLHSAGPDLAAYAVERGATVDIHAAARLGLMERLCECIALDPESVHARGGDGQTPLHFASTVEVATYLLENGAAIEALDVDHESTPAQYMLGDRPEVARFLIARGCKTDLLMAAAVGDLELARRHLDADPDCIGLRVSDEFFPMINGKAGGTIYQWSLGFYASAHQVARKFGHEDVLRLLNERSPEPVKLAAACWLGDAEAARNIRLANPDIAHALSGPDRRQVAHAARNNETEVVRLLIESGFPADATTQHRATPLHWAAFHGNPEMTEILLLTKPDLEARDADFQGTPLDWAIHGSEHGWHARTGDYPATVEALLNAGAKHTATVGGSPAVREVLRRHGAVDGPA
jgi:ankyrin repeat protein